MRAELVHAHCEESVYSRIFHSRLADVLPGCLAQNRVSRLAVQLAELSHAHSQVWPQVDLDSLSNCRQGRGKVPAHRFANYIGAVSQSVETCLLYTSDAADE